MATAQRCAELPLGASPGVIWHTPSRAILSDFVHARAGHNDFFSETCRDTAQFAEPLDDSEVITSPPSYAHVMRDVNRDANARYFTC